MPTYRYTATYCHRACLARPFYHFDTVWEEDSLLTEEEAKREGLEKVEFASGYPSGLSQYHIVSVKVEKITVEPTHFSL